MFSPTHLAVCAIAMLVASLALAANFTAQAAEPAKPMALQSVMQQLGRDMQAIAAAIANEDWKGIAELAPKVANHPAPPLSEKMRILAWLGTDAGKFRGFDKEVHDAAVATGEAASQGDGEAVIAGFARTQRGCLACHQNFRKRFAEHFHEQR